MNDRRARREIPIVMDPGALSDAAQAHQHAHGDDPSASLPGPAPVWLHVAGRPISEAEIAREMQMHRAATPQQAREAAATTLVIRELVRLECERIGLVPEIHDTMAQNSMSQDATPQSSMPDTGETDDEAMVRQLLDREVVSPVPDEAAVRRYFDANRDRLHRPDRAQVDHILLAAAPDDVAGRLRAREQGEALIARLGEAPGRFEEFATLHSACPSHEQGGSLGWIQRGDTVPEFERQVFMLREGLAGLTVETRYGHHVVRVVAFERGAPLSFEEAVPVVSAYLETQARQNAIHDYLQGLRERYPVQGWEHIAQPH